MPGIHAIAFLQDPAAVELPPVVAIFGAEEFLRGEVLRAVCSRLGGEDGESEITRFPGNETDLKTVTDELRTVSMWGDSRVAVVEDADDFVSNHRAALENYVAAPSKSGRLILVVKSWPKNTRLAKAVAKTGLAIECGELKKGALRKWLTDTAKKYGKQLSPANAGMLIELVGEEPGLLSQEVPKLASYAGDRPAITEQDIQAVAGGWATQTAFKMIEELCAGRLPKALEYLDRLLAAGEAPQRTLGGMAYAIRQFARAVESSRHGAKLSQALKDAGVFPNRVDAVNGYLRRIGRPRAERLLSLLLETDLSLKGASRISPRLAMESLVVKLSGQLPVDSTS